MTDAARLPAACPVCGGPLRVGHPCRPPMPAGTLTVADADESVTLVACDVCGTIEEMPAWYPGPGEPVR